MRLSSSLTAIPMVVLWHTASLAAGPLGIGDLKLGMTQPQIEALKGPVRLSSPLTKWEPSKPEDYAPKPGELKLEGMLINPVSGTGEVVLTLTNGRLSSLFLKLNDETKLRTAKSLIEGKYGSPQIDNRQKDEQCIYKSGNSFSLKNGRISYEWEQPYGGGVVTTRLSEYLINICPSNLRYATLGGISIRSLSIDYSQKSQRELNPF
jgi:hypothetical protein